VTLCAQTGESDWDEARRPPVRRTSSSVGRSVGRSTSSGPCCIASHAPKKEFRTRGSALSSAAREGAPTQVSCTHGRCAGTESTLFGHSTHCWIHFGVLIGMPTVYSRLWYRLPPPIRLYVGSRWPTREQSSGGYAHAHARAVAAKVRPDRGVRAVGEN
jgi:hypothetical protein